MKQELEYAMNSICVHWTELLSQCLTDHIVAKIQ